MSSGLAGFRDGTPERFVPGLMSGQLVEAEHLARYWWASRLASRRTVLDAACGVAYGAAALADAGAARVVGVDIADDVLKAVADDMPSAVELRVADLHQLPFADGTFDLVTCFEAIEHVQDRDAVLDELARVARHDAIVLVSSPNRDVYVPGNPHHVHEYRPEELRDALARRFGHVTLVRQYSATASLLLPSREASRTGAGAIQLDGVDSASELTPNDEIYTVAVASDVPLPVLPSGASITSRVEIADWVNRFYEQARVLADQADALREMEELRAQRQATADHLLAAERELARVPDLEQTVEELGLTVGDLERTVTELEQRAANSLKEEAKAAADLARARSAITDITSSFSWRLTKPLRAFKRHLRSPR